MSVYTIATSNVNSADLLTVDEYTRTYVNKVPLIKSGGDWWLSSGNSFTAAAEYSRYVSIVHNSKVDRYSGVVNAHLKVRPKLNLTTSIVANVDGRRVGDLVKFADMMWIILANTVVICEDCIGTCAFNSDWKSPYAQYYTNIPLAEGGTKVSTVKQFINDWLLYWKS